METCFHFGPLARYTVENGMGREITKEECKEMLSHCAEDGLVHALSNVLDGPDTMCNCCDDCCLWLEAFHVLKHAEGLAPSNYLARPDIESCIGCGTCVRRCPMKAIYLKDNPEAKDRVTKITTKDGNVKELKNKTGEVVVINRNICIGCGVCAYKCQSNSLLLERREIIEAPPTTEERQERLKADLAAAIPGQKRKG
jgi:NAD-dependent dihydropyrimidine dehydrogenase PreA subunit